jgi:lipoate-protein ligase A
MEERLLDEVAEDEIILYLWQNQHTVVVGRNQNAWRECHLTRLEDEGGKLARRLSGGGAVYHDLGNLNFTFLMPGGSYNLERQLRVILKAAHLLGIEAEFSGRNDILAAGRKFSGNAFYHGQRASYHHGTLLVDVDLSVLQSYLNVPQQKMAAKGVESVKSRVINLRELVPQLTIEQVKEAMSRAFVAEYGGTGEVMDVGDMLAAPEFKRLYEKYSGWEWRLGKSPAFDITYETRFPWGGIEIGLMVRKGKIEQATIFSDAMEADLIPHMAKRLEGAIFDRETMAESLLDWSRETDTPLAKDVALWIKSIGKED